MAVACAASAACSAKFLPATFLSVLLVSYPAAGYPAAPIPLMLRVPIWGFEGLHGVEEVLRIFGEVTPPPDSLHKWLFYI